MGGKFKAKARVKFLKDYALLNDLEANQAIILNPDNWELIEFQSPPHTCNSAEFQANFKPAAARKSKRKDADRLAAIFNQVYDFSLLDADVAEVRTLKASML